MPIFLEKWPFFQFFQFLVFWFFACFGSKITRSGGGPRCVLPDRDCVLLDLRSEGVRMTPYLILLDTSGPPKVSKLLFLINQKSLKRYFLGVCQIALRSSLSNWISKFMISARSFWGLVTRTSQKLVVWCPDRARLVYKLNMFFPLSFSLKGYMRE